MTTEQGQFGTGTSGARQRATAAYAVSQSYRPGVEAATITAELPSAAGHGFHSVAPTTSSNRRPGHRAAAPVLLRFVVWVEAFLLLAVIVGLVVEVERPAWLAVLRNTAPASVPASATGATNAPTVVATQKITLVQHTATTSTYRVPAAAYKVVVVVSGRCYVSIKAPPSEAGYAFAQTLTGTDTPTAIPANSTFTGEIAVTLDAAAPSLSITSGSHSLGSIADPTLGHTYIFTPTSN